MFFTVVLPFLSEIFHSKDPLPSLSSVKRNEVDDMYVLPALPPTEEKERSWSESRSVIAVQLNDLLHPEHLLIL